MASPAQKTWACSHLISAFDAHSHCAYCEKNKGSDPCVMQQDSSHYNMLTTDQRAQLATPSYKLKKEK